MASRVFHLVLISFLLIQSTSVSTQCKCNPLPPFYNGATISNMIIFTLLTVSVLRYTDTNRKRIHCDGGDLIVLLGRNKFPAVSERGFVWINIPLGRICTHSLTGWQFNDTVTPKGPCLVIYLSCTFLLCACWNCVFPWLYFHVCAISNFFFPFYEVTDETLYVKRRD